MDDEKATARAGDAGGSQDVSEADDFITAPGGPQPDQLRPLTEHERLKFGIAPIRVEGNRFRLCEDGDDGPMGFIVEAETATREVIDFVAWLSSFARRWWSWRELAQILGERELALAKALGKPITLYASPEEWLHSRDRLGVCILDWDCDPRVLLSGVVGVRCTSEVLEDKLRRRIAECSRETFKISRIRGGRHE